MDDEGAIAPKADLNVQAPGAQDIEEHQKTFLLLRSWCPHCVRSKASPNHHRGTAEPPGAKRIATVCIDCLFIRSQGLSFARPVNRAGYVTLPWSVRPPRRDVLQGSPSTPKNNFSEGKCSCGGRGASLSLSQKKKKTTFRSILVLKTDFHFVRSIFI